MLRRAVLLLALVLAAQSRADPPPPAPAVSPPPSPHLALRWARTAPTPRSLAAAVAGHRAVVGLAAGVAPSQLPHVRVVRTLARLRAAVVSGSASRLAALAHDRRVRYLEPVEPVQLAHARDDPLTYEDDPTTGVPWEWAFGALGVDQALNLSKGSSSILVGVLDSGLSPVPDLRGKVAGGLWDTSTTTSAADPSGHGTLISSIVAARNDDGAGLAGFCGACRVLAWKTYPLDTVELATGIRRLTDAHVRVLNISLVSEPSDVIRDAIDYALAAGVLVVAASGNDGAGTISFPASLLEPGSGGLAVGASNATGRRAVFSNFGPQLSLLAPGTYRGSCANGVIGAIPPIAISFDTGTGCEATLLDLRGTRYAYANGTSFAAPEVAGIAALVWAAGPELTNVQVADLLERTATRPPGTGWTPRDGWGVVDANAAVEKLTGRSSADSLRLASPRAGPRAAGGTAVVSVRATWGDGSRVDVGATPSCRVDVRGRAVASRATLARGVVRCTFGLPAASAGAIVRGSVSLHAPTARTATAGFVLRVRRK